MRIKFSSMMLTVCLLISLVAVTAVSFSFYSSASVKVSELSETTKIFKPCGSAPAFALPGDTIVAEIESTVTLPNDGWTVEYEIDMVINSNSLEGDRTVLGTKSWAGTVEKIETGRIKCESKTGYLFTLTVPEGIPPELFDIVLTHEELGTIRSDRAVSVETSFEDSFYIIHLTDEHINYGFSPTRPDGSGGGGTDRTNNCIETKYWSQPVMDLINPRFILHSGDNTYMYTSGKTLVGWPQNPTAFIELLESYANALKIYESPTIVPMNGNHDIGYWDYNNWANVCKEIDRIFGPRAWSTRIGGFYVLVYEYTVADYYPWVLKEWKGSFEDSTIKYRLASSHWYEGWPNDDPERFVNPEYPANLMLVGHGHVNAVERMNPFPILQSICSQHYGRSSFYNFDRVDIKDDDENVIDYTWTCPQVNGRVENRDFFQLWGDWGQGHRVSQDYENENNGTATSNSVTINNQINQNFYDGRVKFLMKKDIYEVENGEILAQYDFGEDMTAVLVKVDIKPLSEMVVNISPKVFTKDDLQELIAEAEDLNEEDYTEESWAVLEDALEHAEEVYDDENATEEDIEEAYVALRAAIDALVPVPDTIPGDVNENGEVTSVDALWVLQYASDRKELTETQFIAADVNYDEDVSAIDALYILQYVSGTRDSLAKPE